MSTSTPVLFSSPKQFATMFGAVAVAVALDVDVDVADAIADSSAVAAAVDSCQSTLSL